MRNVSATAFVAVLSLSTVASANPSFRSGPTVTTTGTRVCVSADVSGLGNIPLVFDMSVDATATTTCRNHGNNVAPGQGTLSASASAEQSCIPDKNGRARCSFCVEVEPADFPTPDPNQVCPNGNWTVDPIRSQNITVTDSSVIITWNGQTLFSSP